MVGEALACVTSVALLLAVFGSKAVVTTLARLVSWPDAEGRTTMRTSTREPPMIVPRVQLTTPEFCEQAPCVGDADTKTTPAGRVLVRSTAVASEGPRLVAVTV